MDDDVTFPGVIPEEEIPAWVAVIAAIAVVIAFSWWEAWRK